MDITLGFLSLVALAVLPAVMAGSGMVVVFGMAAGFHQENGRTAAKIFGVVGFAALAFFASMDAVEGWKEIDCYPLTICYPKEPSQ